MISEKNFWASNLRCLRLRKKLSQDELAEQLGISRSKLNAHENGQTRNPTASDLIYFSAFFTITIDALLKSDLSGMSELKLRTLEGGSEAYATGANLRVLATTVNAHNEDNVELVPVKARAGYTAGYGDPEFIAKLPLLHMPQLPKGLKHRMFPTTGDSMLPVPEGSFVIASFIEDWTALRADTPCVVITGTEGIVFKLTTVKPKEKTVLLASLNAVYAPYEVPLRDVLEIWRFHSFISEALPEPGGNLEELSRTVKSIQGDVRLLLKKK